jgi:aryl-alcohol dehydrogenase-like predicted oxidoreductase
MDVRPLGSTGLLVSAIGLGTVKLGRNRGVKYPGGDGFALPTDEQALALLKAAAEQGVNLLDTAPAYGHAEARLGELMHRAAWLGGRDRWVVCTKVGEEFDNDTGESRFDYSPGHCRASVERSLRRLRTDVLDLVLVHSDGRDEWIIDRTGVLDELRRLRRQGLIRAVGMSVKTLDGALQAVRAADEPGDAGGAGGGGGGGGTGSGGGCEVVMLEHSPAHHRCGLGIDAARLRGAGVLVKKALGSGHLDDLLNKIPPDLRLASQSSVEAALRYVFARPGVSSVVVGTSRTEHLLANAEACRRALASV